MRRSSLLLVGALAACGGSGALFPEDYAATYTEVRGCRSSGDHDLNNIRVLTDPAALPVYRTHTGDFPVGSVVLKEEHDFSDATCTAAPTQWTVMVRLAPGSSPTTLDWKWQRVNAKREVTEEDTPRCYGCHTACGKPPDGYQGTCTMP